jgi:uncharacterized protein (DUF2235 family)
MAKNIVLLSDGTGNAASKVWRTNVWRFFQSLDLTNSSQVACYDDGVGTSAFKPLALLGGTFGWGLKRNVLDLYTFLCRNYEDDCQVYGLGFSRGAFTIRVLMGLVTNQGVIRAGSESDLHRQAAAAYRAYRRERYHSILHIEKLFRGLRDVVIGVWNWVTACKPYDSSQNLPVPSIRFVGVWDTVAAYGLPIDEMTRGVSLWLWPLELPDRTLNKKIRRACHALALDDERTTFHPVLWTEAGEAPAPLRPGGGRFIQDERISQVWFAGVHANIGGGYPDDSLAHVSLHWMMKEARHCGIRFKSTPNADPDAMLHVISSRDKDGRLYDSRQGLGGYYRYGPRKLQQLCDMRFSRVRDDAVKIDAPKIHASAFERGLNGAHVYAPIGLPANYAVVTDEGEILEGIANRYEPPERAPRRAEGQEHVWNLVWWRRVVYFITVAASAHLALFPLIYQTDRAAEFATPLRMVSETIRLIGGFVPSLFVFWLNSYATNPGRFLVAAFLVGALIWIGTRLAAAITDRMQQIWRASLRDILSLPHDWVYALRTSRLYQWLLWVIKRHIVPTLSVVAILYLGLTLSSHVFFNMWDAAGFHCKETETPGAVPWLSEIAIEARFQPRELCWASGIELLKGQRYQVTIAQTSPTWRDGSPLRGGFDTDLAGFEISELPSFIDRVVMVAGVPLRRVLLRPWFRVIGRIGAVGTDEYFIDPDKPRSRRLSVEFRTRRSGELFLYANDTVIGWPSVAGLFYNANEGEAVVIVRHLPR